MDEALVVDRIGWCRGNAHHRYAGTLWVLSDRIRLVGRDATVGIEVSLSIPLDEVEQIEIDAARPETAQSGPCLVLTLVESAPVLVWRVGDGDLSLAEIAARLTGEREASRGPFVLT